MAVNPIPSQVAVQKVLASPVQKQIPADPPKQIPAADKLELSGMSHLVAALKKNEVRLDKVAVVRQQIEAGTYEDDKKLDAAIDKLLTDLAG